jgi:hypothetical protein
MAMEAEQNYEIEQEEETDASMPLPCDEEMVYSYSKAIKKEFDNKFPVTYKEFTEEDYRNLHDNLVLYKTGNAEAGQYIISVFHRFIKKYADFICYGYYGDKKEKDMTKYRKSYDKSLSKFIGLFTPKEKREKVETTLEKNRLFTETCAKIQTLFSKFEYWDIYNELICALLNMANKYKITQEGDEYHKENGTFHMYVSRCFHWDAYNILTKMIGDPLAHLEVYSIYDDYDEIEGDEKNFVIKSGDETVSAMNYISKNIVLKDTDTDRIIEHMMVKADRKKALNDSDKLILKEKEEEIDPYEMESLNFNWTNGSTCGDAFQCLTPYEREILVLSFAQNKTDSEIASIYGCHRITIIKHKKIAIQKMKDEMGR